MIFTVTLNPAVDKTVRLSAPIQEGSVNRAHAVERRVGGKGINVARALRAADMPVVAYTILGGSTGRFISKILAQEKIPARWVTTGLDNRTNTKVVTPDHCVTEFNEPGNPVTGACVRKFMRMLVEDAAAEPTPPLVMLCGSSPQGVENSVYNFLITALRQIGCKVWVDCDGALLAVAMQAKPDLIKPNLEEFSTLLGREITVENAVENAKAFYQETGVPVLLTMGGDGAVYAGPEETAIVPAVPVANPRSTVGAGDRFLAGFATYRAQGVLPAESMLQAAVDVANFLEWQQPDYEKQN